MHGHTKRLETSYREHLQMLRAAMLRLGVDASAVDDAVQDVFVVVVRRIGDFEAARGMRPWLWGIARWVARGHRRADQRRRRLHAQMAIDPAARTMAPLELGDRLELASRLDRLLEAVGPESFAIYWAMEVEGRTGPEVAARLELPLHTVYARLRAVRGRNRTQVEGHVLLWPSWLTRMVVVAGLGGIVVAGVGSLPDPVVVSKETSARSLRRSGASRARVLPDTRARALAPSPPPVAAKRVAPRVDNVTEPSIIRVRRPWGTRLRARRTPTSRHMRVPLRRDFRDSLVDLSRV